MSKGRRGRIVASTLLALTLAAGPAAAADPEPAPPYPPPPPRTYRHPPPPPAYYPPPPVVAAPPPLSPTMRAVYAPFYVAGLVVRYGFYYLIVAPLEVFSRTVGYGVEGGVGEGQAPPPPESKR